MASVSCVLSEDQFLCSICLDVFTDPVTTSCGHSFCSTCINQHWDNCEHCHCPVCKEEFSSRPKIKINTFMAEMVSELKNKPQRKRRKLEEMTKCETPDSGAVLCDVCPDPKLQALKSCLMCQTSFCHLHLQPHHTLPRLQKHQLIGPVKDLEDRICAQHHRPLELFCRDHSKRASAGLETHALIGSEPGSVSEAEQHYTAAASQETKVKREKRVSAQTETKKLQLWTSVNDNNSNNRMASVSCVLSEDQFLCSICLDVFTDPVTTSCGHSFCSTCINQHWDNCEHCHCPVCKEEFSSRPKIKINTFMAEMVSGSKTNHTVKTCETPDSGAVLCDVCPDPKLQALKSCLMCQTSFCHLHLQPHHTLPRLQKHQLIGPVKDLEDRICAQHDRLMELSVETTRRAEMEELLKSDDHFDFVQTFTSVKPASELWDWTEESLTAPSYQGRVATAVSELQNTRLRPKIEELFEDVLNKQNNMQSM
ncbi:hypothetical protein WMY93_033992 [Mugilogobius chulae]|uniref:RING-type domain-containing protein n=1 Tax=Mugilogobius chulae TaxID=88201 RepID=A0AAW0ML35_9GOBI